MNNFLLSKTGRLLFPFLLIMSLIVLYRGLNLPGGGFIGGLMAATAFILYALGDSIQAARQKLRVDPVILMAVGLLIAVVSGFFSMFLGKGFMTGLWLPTLKLPLLGTVHLGTPLIFDVGVFLTVIGFTLHTTFSFAKITHLEDDEEEES